MLKSTIPNWVQASSKIDSNSVKRPKTSQVNIWNDGSWPPAVVCCQWSWVFEAPSLLDPTYEKIKVALKEKLVQSEAENVSVCLDAWSSFHHGYLGMTVHFISKDWNRVKFCISCSQFDERHTAKNIFNKIETTAEEWEISSKIGVCLRDNAANVKAAFNELGCKYESAGCLSHSFNLWSKKN